MLLNTAAGFRVFRVWVFRLSGISILYTQSGRGVLWDVGIPRIALQCAINLFSKAESLREQMNKWEQTAMGPFSSDYDVIVTRTVA